MKEIPQKADSREYEKTMSSKFSSKWQDGQNGITPACEGCVENKQSLLLQSILTSSKFTDGLGGRGYWASENVSGRVQSERHSLGW